MGMTDEALAALKALITEADKMMGSLPLFRTRIKSLTEEKGKCAAVVSSKEAEVEVARQKLAEMEKELDEATSKLRETENQLDFVTKEAFDTLGRSQFMKQKSAESSKKISEIELLRFGTLKEWARFAERFHS